MKLNVKLLLILLNITFIANSYSKTSKDDEKTVSLIVSGQGKTQDQAKQSALRNAIEQAFGAFISTHTEIVNDNLIKDEIISVSSGNIQKYEVVSEAELPDNMGYTTTLKAKVSISKLTSFCESKGMKIEIKGSLFAFNIIQKELSATNEAKALDELYFMAKDIAPKMFDYKLVSSEPFKYQPISKYELKNDVKPYCLTLKVEISVNNNWETYYKILTKTLNGLAIKKSELDDYKKLNLSYFTFDIYTNRKNFKGNYEYYSCPSAGNCLISEQDYDEIIWKNEFNIKTNNYSLKGYGGGDAKIIADGFKMSNYDINTLYFRNDIKSILSSINKLIMNEAFNYKIQNQASSEINSKYIKVLFPLISDGVQPWQSNSSNILITYKKEDFKIRTSMYSASFENALNNNSIILQKINPGSTICFGYYCPLFDLDEIKNLSKLEVKHK